MSRRALVLTASCGLACGAVALIVGDSPRSCLLALVVFGTLWAVALASGGRDR